MQSYRDVIGLWPSLNTLAEDLGEKPETVRKWWTRDSIPPRVWDELIVAAKRRRYKVKVDHLAALARSAA